MGEGFAFFYWHRYRFPSQAYRCDHTSWCRIEWATMHGQWIFLSAEGAWRDPPPDG